MTQVKDIRDKEHKGEWVMDITSSSSCMFFATVGLITPLLWPFPQGVTLIFWLHLTKEYSTASIYIGFHVHTLLEQYAPQFYGLGTRGIVSNTLGACPGILSQVGCWSSTHVSDLTYTKINSYWSIYARNIIVMKSHPTGTRVAIGSISSIRIRRDNPSVHKTKTNNKEETISSVHIEKTFWE